MKFSHPCARRAAIVLLSWACLNLANAATLHTWVLSSQPLSEEQLSTLSASSRLLIMVPGVSSGDLSKQCAFLEQIRALSGHDLAIFFDRQPGTLSRRMVSPAATGPAAQNLVTLCRTFLGSAAEGKTIDLLAHSSGTVVVNKAAEIIVADGSSVRFRNILLLGTALSSREPLDALITVSTRILNLHSMYDKVNRSINDSLGVLPALEGGAGRNIRMDRSLSGRLVRHPVFIASNPESWIAYAAWLGEGRWPGPRPPVDECPRDLAELHGLALWVQRQPDTTPREVHKLIPGLLTDPDPAMKYYGVVLAGLLDEDAHAAALKLLLEDEDTPVYVRKEIYQALGNLRDGRHVDYLRHARERDPECGEEIRDVLRELKRQRVDPVR